MKLHEAAEAAGLFNSRSMLLSGGSKVDYFRESKKPIKQQNKPKRVNVSDVDNQVNSIHVEILGSISYCCFYTGNTI